MDDEAEPVAPETSGPAEVHYWFPVEIEVVGAADGEFVDRVVERVYDGLSREMASRPWL
jgi:hypothetical protein